MLWKFEFDLISVFVIADTKSEALKKIRKFDSKARKDYPTYNFDRLPDSVDWGEEMITHFGYD
jgi:hypothetical protein